MQMKNTLFLILFFPLALFSQNVGINATGAAPNASAMLDISATNKGVLIPQVALSARNNNAPIGAGIATSLLVYNTATAGTAPNDVYPGYYYWDGAEWDRVVGNVVERWYVNPMNINNNTTYTVTVTIPGVTSTSSVMVNLVGDWTTQPNVTIHHVEARTGNIRFRISNNTTTTNYIGMDFIITIIR
jgi:hypothetical protein